MTAASRGEIAKAIDAIEEAYEFFLAYAAQGITDEARSSRVGAQLRAHLDKMADAIAGLPASLDALAEEEEGDRLGSFRELVQDDAQNAAAIVSLVRAQDSISSQLVDNLNASIHIRTLLTDLFLLDETLKLGVDQGTAPETAGSAT